MSAEPFEGDPDWFGDDVPPFAPPWTPESIAPYLRGPTTVRPQHVTDPYAGGYREGLGQLAPLLDKFSREMMPFARQAIDGQAGAARAEGFAIGARWGAIFGCCGALVLTAVVYAAIQFFGHL